MARLSGILRDYADRRENAGIGVHAEFLCNRSAPVRPPVGQPPLSTVKA